MKNIEQLFFFPDLEPVTNETNGLSIRKAFLLPIFLPAAILEKEDDDSLSSVTSDNDTQTLRQLTRICHTPNRYAVVAHCLGFSGMVPSRIYESFNYNQAI